jgi:hypothetical protein
MSAPARLSTWLGVIGISLFSNSDDHVGDVCQNRRECRSFAASADSTFANSRLKLRVFDAAPIATLVSILHNCAGVITFRRNHLPTAVAVLLVALAVSPVTASFSKLSFAAIAHRSTSVELKTVYSLKSVRDHVMVPSGVDRRTAFVPLIESPVRFVSASVERESTRFAVLRL